MKAVRSPWQRTDDRSDMITIRRSEDRGRANYGWLDTKHTFSFGSYFEPSHMGFGPLRVINEDRVSPGQGFGEHGHENMEIISYVLEGSLEHKDSLGSGSVLLPGEVQRMSAGTGIRHSEFNASDSEPVHFLQIWIEPESPGLEPSYEQKDFSGEINNGLTLVVSGDGRDGSLHMHRDTDLYAGKIPAGESFTHELGKGRQFWLQAVRGEAEVNGQLLYPGDGASGTEVDRIVFKAVTDAEILIFDMKTER